jgi:uncharacterized membrane protein
MAVVLGLTLIGALVFFLLRRSRKETRWGARQSVLLVMGWQGHLNWMPRSP